MYTKNEPEVEIVQLLDVGARAKELATPLYEPKSAHAYIDLTILFKTLVINPNGLKVRLPLHYLQKSSWLKPSTNSYLHCVLLCCFIWTASAKQTR